MSLKDRVLAHYRRMRGNPVSLFHSDKAKPKANAKPVDLEDPNKVHPLDPPHIASALEDEHVAREEGFTREPEQKPEDLLPPSTEQRPRLTQYTINCRRVSVLRVLIQRAQRDVRKGMSDAKVRAKYGRKHLWFLEDFADNYALRDGNPPSDTDRPKYLRGLALVVDIWDPGSDLVWFAKQQGAAWQKATRSPGGSLVRTTGGLWVPT